ncbi:hypothetical protein D3C81_998840 [compost metagenome]
MDKKYYVVRGADIGCTCGSHLRKLNLPVSHGTYVNGQPMMNETDCKLEDNISCFGICSSPLNQSGETIYLISMEGEQIQGKPCLPVLLGDRWNQTKTKVKVDAQSVLTTDSELYCALDGVIKFASNGQQEG